MKEKKKPRKGRKYHQSYNPPYLHKPNTSIKRRKIKVTDEFFKCISLPTFSDSRFYTSLENSQ